MVDQTAFYSLSYGLYIIASQTAERRAGCISNTFQQVTSSPLQVSVVLNKDNATTQTILAAGRFTATSLAKDATMEIIQNFGFRSSETVDKFEEYPFEIDAAGIPFVAQQVCARFSVLVTQTIDIGTHLIFVGEVQEAENLRSCDPMTYAYYHQVKGGKTPPKASSYLPDVQSSSAEVGCIQDGFVWRCNVCGHLEYVDELPDDYVCPVCGATRDFFEKIEGVLD